MTEDARERLEAEQELVKDLDDLFEAYKDSFPEIQTELSTVLVNYGIRSLLFCSDPLVMSEAVSASMTAWMSFARKLTEEEDNEEPTTVQRIQVISRDDEAPDPRALVHGRNERETKLKIML